MVNNIGAQMVVGWVGWKWIERSVLQLLLKQKVELLLFIINMSAPMLRILLPIARLLVGIKHKISKTHTFVCVTYTAECAGE